MRKNCLNIIRMRFVFLRFIFSSTTSFILLREKRLCDFLQTITESVHYYAVDIEMVVYKERLRIMKPGCSINVKSLIHQWITSTWDIFDKIWQNWFRSGASITDILIKRFLDWVVIHSCIIFFLFFNGFKDTG